GPRTGEARDRVAARPRPRARRVGARRGRARLQPGDGEPAARVREGSVGAWHAALTRGQLSEEPVADPHEDLTKALQTPHGFGGDSPLWERRLGGSWRPLP